MNSPNVPNWVRKNPEKYLKRLQFEGAQIAKVFPYMQIFLHNGHLMLEGPVITRSMNQYVVRIVYPENYPFSKPEAYVRDADVIRFCTLAENYGHSYHNYGAKSEHGLHLCLLGNADGVNKGWTPNQTGMTILEYAVLWLHAYEYKRKTGNWPLFE